MAQVTVNHLGITITISSRDMMQAGSLDLTDDYWSEYLAWDPAKVKAALQTLHAQPHVPRRVNCRYGQNRSPTMATLYLWWRSGQALGLAYNAVGGAYAGVGAVLDTDKIESLIGQLLGAYSGVRRWNWNNIAAMIPGQAAEVLP